MIEPMARSFCLIVLVLSLLLKSQLFAMEKLSFAAPDMPPYVSPDINDGGYISELVRAAFKSQGVDIEVEYFPLVRAKLMAGTGQVTGVFPLQNSAENEAEFYFSDPVRGNELWVFEDIRKSEEGVGVEASPFDKGERLFGVLRGQAIPVHYQPLNLSNQYSVNTNIQLLDLIDAGRVSHIIMDKYTLADVMVNNRPHLIGLLKPTDGPILKKPFYIGFPRKNPQSEYHVHVFNKGLSYLKSTGRYDDILEKHGVYEPDPVKNDKTVINVAAINNQFVENIRSLTDSFEKAHPDIRVKWDILEENVLRRRLMEDIATGESYFDILAIGAYEAQIWAEKGWISPLKNIDQQYNLEDISPSLLEGATYQKQIYALPFLSESTMAFYRTDLFKAAGVNLPEVVSYTELEEYIRKVHNPERQIYGIGLRGKAGWGQNMAFVSVLVNTFGGRWFDENWEPAINTPEWKKALTYYKNIMQKYGPPDNYKNGWKENQDLFIDGKIAFLIDATSFAPVLFNPEHKKIRGLVGIRNPPVESYPRGAYWLWWWGLAINSKSVKQDAAQAFILWATSQDYAQELIKRKGYSALPLGVRRSFMTTEFRNEITYADTVLNTIDKASNTFFTIQPVPYKGPQFVAIPEFPAIGNQVGAKIARMLKGEKTVDDVLKESQYLVKKIMDKAGYYKRQSVAEGSQNKL